MNKMHSVLLWFFAFMAVLAHFLIWFEYELTGWDLKSLVARYCPKGSCLEAQTCILRFPPTPPPLASVFLSTAAEICLCLGGNMNDSLFIDKKSFSIL